jgi:hypothetical protein
VRLEQPGYQVPIARSQKDPPPEMCTVVSRVVAPMAVARPEVPTDQWADSRCSSGRLGECEPSIMTVSITVITVLHSTEVVHMPHES